MTTEKALEVLKESEAYIEKLETELRLSKMLANTYQGQALYFKNQMEIARHEIFGLREKLNEKDETK